MKAGSRTSFIPVLHALVRVRVGARVRVRVRVGVRVGVSYYGIVLTMAPYLLWQVQGALPRRPPCRGRRWPANPNPNPSATPSQARQQLLGSELVSVGRYSERVRESGRDVMRHQEALVLGQGGSTQSQGVAP